jgi:hypothetical protein
MTGRAPPSKCSPVISGVDGTLVIVRAAAQILGAAQAAIGAGHQRHQSVDLHVSRYQ